MGNRQDVHNEEQINDQYGNQDLNRDLSQNANDDNQDAIDDIVVEKQENLQNYIYRVDGQKDVILADRERFMQLMNQV